jgi:hypothetical protein
VIAYGLHIDTRVEMLTLGETKTRSFFLNLKIVRLIATQAAAPVSRQ